MTKEETLTRLLKTRDAVMRLPDEFEVAEVEVGGIHNARIHVRAVQDDALYRYANDNSLYCKTLVNEFDSYQGIHALDENGVEILQMVKRDV